MYEARSGEALPAGRAIVGRWVAAAAVTVALGWGPSLPARADVRLPDDLPSRVVNASTGAEVLLGDVPGLSTGLPAIGVPAMRLKYPFIDGAGQTLAVIDTGIDYTHPALVGRYVGGYDFADGDDDPLDWHGHGTHVAGIAVSTDATYAGVAPGANVVGLKVFPDGLALASDHDIVSALDWVIGHRDEYNITAVNLSLGNGEPWTEQDANPLFHREQAFSQLKDMGVFIACAAGNDGYLRGVNYPAASPHVVSVGGTWASDDYSGYIVYWDDARQWDGGEGYVDARMADNGPLQGDIAVISNRYRTDDDGELDLFAPGAVITSTFPYDLDTDDGEQDGWQALLGTSMATPHAAAASMLVRQALEANGMLDPDPAGQVDQILEILQEHGTTLNDWYVGLMREEGLGDHRNLVQVPKGDDLGADWYIRMGSNEQYALIDLDAAISSIDPIPEPTGAVLLILGAAALLRRRH